MTLFDLIFNFFFTVEAVAKIAAWGLYTPRNVHIMSYLQTVQNRVDLFVLMLAIADMTDAAKYIGTGTTKVIRLMKVMRPVRLLMRSQGLKTIIEALVSSLKPMAYATLFLLIVCTMFSVTGMALFRNKFHFCNDTSLDGLLGQGLVECSGTFVDKNIVYAPRTWDRPAWGSHFDSLDSSIAVLFKCLTLNWVGPYSLAQDAYQQDMQPVIGYSMAVASLYFHLFLLVGSFFGLNLFASFMCDTFYSLQGTAQLEEVQVNLQNLDVHVQSIFICKQAPTLCGVGQTLVKIGRAALTLYTGRWPRPELKWTCFAVDGSPGNACCQQTDQTQKSSQKHLLNISARIVGFEVVAKRIRQGCLFSV